MNLQLHLFAPKTDRYSSFQDLNNQCFELWKETWSNLYRKAKSESAFKIDDYYRQDFVSTLVYDNQVAALWLNTSFSLGNLAAREHSYFKFYDDDVINWLRNRKIEDVLSVEFLTANPKLLRAHRAFAFIKAVGPINSQILQNSPQQAMIATARTDVPAARVGYDVGWECVKGNTLQRGFPCDLVVCPKTSIQPHPDQEVQSFAEQVWANRIDSIFPQIRTTLKIAA